ncbi:hamartin [Fopius arisanus]|uniref:Hamartin n=1 Tax=Fopius arisanus TaxID=64838 RepID=A0A0C9QSW5_9HYME|nr:PREDICTED: hamartin [Fopius arisanus]
MSVNSSGVADFFHMLESNKLSDVEEIKKVFHDHFLSTKDSWLVNGLFDYYLSTDSLRTIEVLAGVREPHDKYLLDRLSDTLARPSSSGQRLKVLTVLGHVARRQPTLYKLANHPLFRELLKLLKVDSEALSLMSGLLLLVTLLPMLPAALGPYLHEIFEVFGRLASYYHFQSSNLASTIGSGNSMDKDQLYLLHLQVGLYSLFHRLYAMYPCNFIAYLKQQYSQRDHDVFKLTIKPMLESVRLHPLLVTASKDVETNAARWKKMEHHDVVAECGRFALDRSREEILAPINLRATPIPDHLCPYTPVSVAEGLSGTRTTNGDEDSFWSPSMAIPPHSPPPLSAPSLEPRSTPSTPNNNRSNSSPPEAAVEATPETTPVKDIRQVSSRQPPLGSAAVRALGAFGNGSLTGNSRPSTPTFINSNASAFSGIGGSGDGGILSQKINRLVADRQSVLQTQRSFNFEGVGRGLESSPGRNGKNDSWKEDQEVEIVNSQACRSLTFLERQPYNDDKARGARGDLSKKIKRLRFYSQCPSQQPCPLPQEDICNVRRTNSCPDMKPRKKLSTLMDNFRSIVGAKCSEEVGTQTSDLIPYEHLLVGLLEQRHHEQQASKQSAESRLSPSSMLDRYIEACSRISSSTGDKKRLRKKDDDRDDWIEDFGSDNPQLQMMQMQLLFERQRREVHAERNRRLLGKLRDSRALEEQNAALTDRLRMAESEIEGFKGEIDRNKKESRIAEERYADALHHWQSKCVEEQNQNRLLREKVEAIELELKNEKKRVIECEQQARSAEALLFDAAHQLKCALKAASRGDELKRTLDLMHKRFLLLGEAQSKLQERTSGPVPMSRQEAAQIQRAYSEELSNLKRQLDSRTSMIEALRVRLVELESRETRTEAQLIDQQRLLQEAKDRNEAELCAVESKYKSQVEINLLLESRILELHGSLEAATIGSGSAAVNLASSASPKERSPPLSGSLASSSEGSLAFHSSTGIISDCCDSAGEIANLQAIVEPAPSTSSQATTPSRSSHRHVPKRD